MMEPHSPIITNDAVLFGILAAILALIFKTEKSPRPVFKKFYKFVPSLLLCYFIPSLLNTFGFISPDDSKLYFVASRYLLPTSLVLLTLSADFSAIIKLGPKALVMFFTGTLGVMLGGPIALWTIWKLAPSVVETAGADNLWRGLATICGSWIGGGANMTAMKEVFQVDTGLFAQMVAIDVLVGSLWFGLLLYAAQRSKAIDAYFKADVSAIEIIKEKVETFQKKHARIPTATDLMVILGIGFGVTGFSHLGADALGPWLEKISPQLAQFSLTSPFFWLVILATTAGILLSFTKARQLEGAGASRIGTVCLYFLVATIGMQMNVLTIFENPGLFLLGFLWISIHGILMLLVAKILRAPFFLTAVGSQANIGAAASAPIIAAAFHPSLATVGVLLAVLGYGIGNYAAWITAQVMRILSGG